MKRITRVLNLLLIGMIFSTGAMLASFPVKSIEKSTAATTSTTSIESGMDKKQVAVKMAEVKKAESKTTVKGPNHDKEFWITLVLLLVLGGVAAHRWYRGKPVGWNILFILTGGGCGIWAIVDLINILRGNF